VDRMRLYPVISVLLLFLVLFFSVFAGVGASDPDDDVRVVVHSFEKIDDNGTLCFHLLEDTLCYCVRHLYITIFSNESRAFTVYLDGLVSGSGTTEHKWTSFKLVLPADGEYSVVVAVDGVDHTFPVWCLSSGSLTGGGSGADDDSGKTGYRWWFDVFSQTSSGWLLSTPLVFIVWRWWQDNHFEEL